MKVHVVTESSWICKKLANYLSGELGKYRVRVTTDSPRDAMVTYYLTYLFREFYKPVPGSRSVALFTHFIPGRHQKRYDQISRQVDHCVVLSEFHRKYLSKKVGDQKVSRVHIPIAPTNQPVPALKVGWFHRSPEGYDRRKRTDLARFAESLPWVHMHWSKGKLSQDKLHELMNYVDVFLTTSDQESGPACLLEGLSLGKQIVIPSGVGLADEYAHVNGVHLFEPGNKESLKQALETAYRPLLDRYSAVKDNTVTRWREDHEAIFDKVLG